MPATTTARHHSSLADDLLATGPLRTKSKKRKAKRDEEDGDGYIDSKASRKILKIGQELAEEDRSSTKQSSVPSTAFTFESRLDESSGAEEGDSYDDNDEAWGDEDDVIEEVVHSASHHKSVPFLISDTGSSAGGSSIVQ